MAKIAGYVLIQHVDRGDEWLNAVDQKSIGPFAMHRQCIWEDDGLRMVAHGEVEIVTSIPLEDADRHVCSSCGEKLSTPAYFSFEEEYKHLHECIGWIQTITHEVEIGISGNYQDVVDSTTIVCRDCEPTCPDGFFHLERIESKDNYRCSVCNIPMLMIGKRCMKEERNGACDTIQFFHFEQFAPSYYVTVVSGGLRKKWYREIYELHALSDAEALYEALMKVSVS